METEWSTGDMDPVKAYKYMRDEFKAAVEDSLEDDGDELSEAGDGSDEAFAEWLEERLSEEMGVSEAVQEFLGWDEEEAEDADFTNFQDVANAIIDNEEFKDVKDEYYKEFLNSDNNIDLHPGNMGDEMSAMNEKDVLKYSFDDTQGTPRYRPGGGSDDGDEVYMEIRSKLTPEMQKKILKTIKREVFIDCRFEVKGNKLMLLIPFSGDYENVKGVLDSLGVKIKTI